MPPISTLLVRAQDDIVAWIDENYKKLEDGQTLDYQIEFKTLKISLNKESSIEGEVIYLDVEGDLFGHIRSEQGGLEGELVEPDEKEVIRVGLLKINGAVGGLKDKLNAIGVFPDQNSEGGRLTRLLVGWHEDVRRGGCLIVGGSSGS